MVGELWVSGNRQHDAPNREAPNTGRIDVRPVFERRIADDRQHGFRIPGPRPKWSSRKPIAGSLFVSSSGLKI